MHRGYFKKKRMHLFNASTSAVVGSAIDLANSSLAECNSMRSADKYASRMTLERYDVESCGEGLIVRELSLVRSPGVFTPLLFASKPELLINSSECPWVSFDFNTLCRLSKWWYNPSYHTVQKSYFTRVKELWSRTQCCNESVSQVSQNHHRVLSTLTSLTGCLCKHGLNTPML